MDKFYIVSEYIVDHYLKPNVAEYLKSGKYANYETKIHDLDIPIYADVKISDQCKLLGMKSFDSSIPIGFVHECQELLGQNPVGKVVMCYDKNSFGVLTGITREGVQLMAIYNHIKNQ